MNLSTPHHTAMKRISGLILSLLAMAVYAQQPATASVRSTRTTVDVTMKTVTGLVKEASTATPMIGVRVQAYGNSRYAAMSAEDGTFSIRVPDFVSALTLEADGYGLLLVPIDPSTNKVQANLYPDAFAASYERKQKATLDQSSSIATLNGDVSIDKQIQTGLGGSLRSLPRSGQVGIGHFMLMNGINSLSANVQPLVVIDGVIFDMQYNRTTVHDGFYNNLLTNLSVSDIEKVTVLKNGTALYGAKGANGVLLIDTKRNKSMATKIDVDLTGQFEQIPNLPPMMDATDYRYYASELLGTTGTKLTTFKFLNTDPNYYYYNQYNNQTDWSKEVYQEAFSQQYGINVQGGDEIASYNLSVGYSDANNTLKSFDMNRFNLRLNADINLTSKLDVRFDASYSDVNRSLRDDGISDNFANTTITSVGLLGLIKAPFLNPYQFDIYGNQSGFLSDADDYLDEVLGTRVSLANPAALLEYGSGKNKNIMGNRLINLAITPIYRVNSRLTLKEHFSYTLVNTNANYYTPLRGMPSLVIEDVATVENVAKAMASKGSSFFSDTRADWARMLGAHDIHVYGGVRLVNNMFELNRIQGYNTGNDKTPNLNTSLAYKTTIGIDDKNLSLTYYALADYAYKGTYLLSGGLSMESSSRFGRETEGGLNFFGASWGLFPSVQGAWILTNESWLRPNKTLNFLKLNLGFDLSGNDDMDNTATRTYFGAVRIMNNIGGLVLQNIGNTKLQWETTKRLTAGAEANLFDNRLNLAYNLFWSRTDNLLSLKALSYLGGLDNLWSNDGALSNAGYDVSLNFKALNTKSVQIELGGSVGHYANKLTALPNNNQSFTSNVYGASILSQVGSPVGLFYGYQTDGVYKNSDLAQADGKYIVLRNGERKYFGAGDMNFVTTNDAEVNELDQVVIGNPNPDLYGNLFANLTIKRLSLNTVFAYSMGNDIFNYQRMILEGGNAFHNQTTALNKRWTRENQETDIPVITFEDPMGNSRFSDRWIEDGSYLRLKTITLSYALPIQSTYLQGLTFWASGNNLLTFTNYLGGDPEHSASNNILLQGIDRGLLPQGKTVAVGIKINL